NLTFSSGTIGGTGTFNVTGAMTWTGGAVMSDAGTTVIAAGATLNINAPSSSVFLDNGRTLTNNRTTTWTAGNIELLCCTSNFINNAGTWDIKADGTMFSDVGGQLFHNLASGTFKKTAGTGSGGTVINVPFDNEGTIQASSGLLDLTASLA